MSIKAILTTLILGTSSVALARPAPAREPARGPVVRDHRESVGRDHRETVARDRREPIVRDHRETVIRERPRAERERFEHREWARRPIIEHRIERPIVRYREPGYVYEQAPIIVTPFVNGAMSIAIGGAGTGIELASNGGSTYVEQVAIQYADGRSQLVQVGAYVDASNPTLDLGSDGSPIASVVIYGSGAGLSAYAI